MGSKTLGLVFAYWSGNLKSFEGDGYIDLPFNLELFCAANDKTVSTLEEEVKYLKERVKFLAEKASENFELAVEYEENLVCTACGALKSDGIF